MDTGQLLQLLGTATAIIIVWAKINADIAVLKAQRVEDTKQLDGIEKKLDDIRKLLNE